MGPEMLFAFCATYALAVATPGPFVAAMVARSMAQGLGTGLAMSFGAGCGDLVWALCALFGLALVADALAPLMAVLKYIGAGYIAWIGWRLIRSRGAAARAMETGAEAGFVRPALSGFFITLGNPKPIAFFLAVLPGLFDLGALTLADKLMILCVIPPVLMSVLGVWALLGARSRRLMRSERAMTRVHRGAGGAMMAAGAAIAAT